MKKNENNLILAKEWFNKARDDEKTVSMLLREGGPYTVACFHSHQIAEKYLKGFLTFKKQKFRKIHDLIQLLKECAKFDKAFLKFSTEANELNSFYIASRYPGEYEEIYSENQAKKAFKAAKKIKNFILKKMKK
jgi:HEPN domain-containing protein